jgi:hypothetical protein
MACWAMRAQGSIAVACEEALGPGLGGTGLVLDRLSAAVAAHLANLTVDLETVWVEIASVVTTKAAPARRAIDATGGTLALSCTWLGSICSSKRLKVRK